MWYTNSRILNFNMVSAVPYTASYIYTSTIYIVFYGIVYQVYENLHEAFNIHENIGVFNILNYVNSKL